MKKMLFFAVTAVGIFLLSMQLMGRARLMTADRELTRIQQAMTNTGWNLSVREKSASFGLLNPHIILQDPVLSDQNGVGWSGKRLLLKYSLRHPFSITIAMRGSQIIRLGSGAYLSFPGLTGNIDSRGQLHAGITALTAVGAPGSMIKTVILRHVTASLLPGSDPGPDAALWALDVHAQDAELQTKADIAALLATLPALQKLHLVLTAVRGASPDWTSKAGYERFLIQTASMTLGPLSIALAGSIDPDGKGLASAHLKGLKQFTGLWLSRIPRPLAEQSEYDHILQLLNEQTARIPDQLDVPIPLGNNDITLQNHIFAIISGYSH